MHASYISAIVLGLMSRSYFPIFVHACVPHDLPPILLRLVPQLHQDMRP